MIGNKIADKITSVGKSKNKQKKYEANEIEEIYIPPDNELLMTSDCFRHHMKMEYQKITNLLGNIPDKVPRSITKR